MELHDLGILEDPVTLADSMEEHAEVTGYTDDGYLKHSPEFHVAELELIITALRLQSRLAGG